MKSALIAPPSAFRRTAERIRAVSARLSEDLVSAGAAQAAFFLVTSAVPFLSLLAALTGILLPKDLSALPLPDALISGSTGELFRVLTDQIASPPGVPLMSFTAVTTLWTSSKGICALRGGIGRIYRCESGRGPLFSRLAGMLTTLAVMAVAAASSLLLLFGGALLSLSGGDTLSGRAAEALTKALSLPLFFMLLTAVFTLLYAAAGRKSALLKGKPAGHLPGALFSALGWILFSLLYSVYIAHFPRASAVYGALGAVCLVMLWLYVCTVILLLGAEINRVLAEKRGR